MSSLAAECFSAKFKVIIQTLPDPKSFQWITAHIILTTDNLLVEKCHGSDNCVIA